jgi:hypothetical protein
MVLLTMPRSPWTWSSHCWVLACGRAGDNCVDVESFLADGTRCQLRSSYVPGSKWPTAMRSLGQVKLLQNPQAHRPLLVSSGLCSRELVRGEELVLS